MCIKEKCLIKKGLIKFRLIQIVFIFALVFVNTAQLPIKDFKMIVSSTESILANDTAVYASSKAMIKSTESDLSKVALLPRKYVMVGGHSIGVMVSDKGVTVVGHYGVEKDGKRLYPAKSSGIQVGDILSYVNDKIVQTAQDVEILVNELYDGSNPLHVKVVRDKEEQVLSVTPSLSDEGVFKLGIYVRDNAAGVGTLTFWEPESGKFGALGHVVTDSQDGKEIVISEGSLILTEVAGIHVGRSGSPGEKIGTFTSNTQSIGVIKENSTIGVYGKLLKKLNNPIYDSPIQMATKSEIKIGEAELLTVIEGDKIESFKCDITKIMNNDGTEGKNLMIAITDERLLEKTGGIIQGMSGSPLIQNGRFVGAVTHVMVSDPTKGYGIIAEDMYKAAQSVSASFKLQDSPDAPI